MNLEKKIRKRTKRVIKSEEPVLRRRTVFSEREKKLRIIRAKKLITKIKKEFVESINPNTCEIGRTEIVKVIYGRENIDKIDLNYLEKLCQLENITLDYPPMCFDHAVLFFSYNFQEIKENITRKRRK